MNFLWGLNKLCTIIPRGLESKNTIPGTKWYRRHHRNYATSLSAVQPKVTGLGRIEGAVIKEHIPRLCSERGASPKIGTDEIKSESLRLNMKFVSRSTKTSGVG